MTNDENTALQTIRGYASAGRIVVTSHARQRMFQRGASDRDVRAALSNASDCRDQRADVTTAGDWKITGPDTDGDALSCAVCIDGAVVVVTVF